MEQFKPQIVHPPKKWPVVLATLVAVTAALAVSRLPPTEYEAPPPDASVQDDNIELLRRWEEDYARAHGAIYIRGSDFDGMPHDMIIGGGSDYYSRGTYSAGEFNTTIGNNVTIGNAVDAGPR